MSKSFDSNILLLFQVTIFPLLILLSFYIIPEILIYADLIFKITKKERNYAGIFLFYF